MARSSRARHRPRSSPRSHPRRRHRPEVKRFGGFTNSGLAELLASRGIDTVVLTGVATNLSVEGTARQASDLGYRTVVVSDACSAADEATHAASLATMGLLGEIVTSADFAAALKAPSTASAVRLA